jgi:flagellin
MSLVLANNVASLNAQHNLHRSTLGMNRSLERLSSGFKINRGADGPAALVISEKQRAQIAGLEQAIENSAKAVSVVQTAEGALSEINSLLVKIRSLALDSANSGVNDADAQAANQAEIDNALDTINRIANNTQFANKKLLDGSAGISGSANDAEVTFLKASTDTVAGTYAVAITTAGSRGTVTAGTAQANPLAAEETLTVNGVAISLSAGLSQTEVINRINEFTDQTGVVADANGAGGATRLYTIAFGTDASIEVVSNVAAAATSTGFGTTAASDTGSNIIGTIGGTSYTGKGNVLTANSGAANGISVSVAADAGANAHQTVTGAQGEVTVTDNSLVFQIGPNQHQTAEINIDRVNPESLGIGVNANQFANLDEIDITSASKAQDAIGVIDAAINEVTTMRGRLGAFQQNTLEATANNLRTTLENSVNAESVIRDTDFAEEIAKFTQHQVLVQAGTSILSSANQASQLVLSLL